MYLKRNVFLFHKPVITVSKFVNTTKSSVYENNVVYAEEKKVLLNPMISFTVRLDIKKL